MEKRYNRLLTVIFALVMVFTMSVNVFAYTTQDDDGDREKQEHSEDTDWYNNNIVYSNKGMFRVMDNGTSVTDMGDGTVKVVIKIKPLASGKYDRMALVNYPATGTTEEKTAFLDANAINADKTESGLGLNVRANVVEMLYSPEFTFTIPAEDVGKKIPVVYSQVTDESEKGTWISNVKDRYYLIVLNKEERKDYEALAESRDTSERSAARKALEDGQAENISIYTSSNQKAIKAALGELEAAVSDTSMSAWKLSTVVKSFKDALSKAKKDKQAADKKKATIATIKGTKITGLKVKAAKKMMTVSWKKNTKVFAGYQLQYKKKGAKAKTVKITKASTAKKVIKKLKSRKKYTVKVRGYKKAYGSVLYGKWSVSKTVKIK